MSRYPREDQAIEIVEGRYGSLEEFSYKAASMFPELISGDYNLRRIAIEMDIDPTVLGRVIVSPAFANAARRMMALRGFSFLEEAQHIKIVRDTAINPEANIHNVIAAREHLARLQGSDLNPKNNNVVVPVQINFQTISMNAEVVDERTYQGARAGDLPPPTVQRAKNLGSQGAGKTINGVEMGSPFDFYSGESPYRTEE